jgi:hypothetical protein
MGQITFDYQVISQTCECCQKEFDVSRGSVYDGGQGIGIYIAALHACHPDKIVHLAIALRQGNGTSRDAYSWAIRVWPTETEIQMSVVDAAESPWQNETYLGRMMDRQEALSNPLLDIVFHIADHIVTENPVISTYLQE